MKLKKPHKDRIIGILTELYTYGWYTGHSGQNADREGIDRAEKELVKYLDRIKLND